MFSKPMSVPRMLGIPTLVAGVFATVTVLWAGASAGVLSEPAYWPAIVVAVPWIPIGLGAIYWDGSVIQNVLVWCRLKDCPTTAELEQL